MSTTDTPLTASPTRGRIGFSRKAKAYLALTKPRVIELLLVTTVPVMIFAESGFPKIGLVLATLMGGSHWRRLRRRVQLLPRPRHRQADAPHRERPLVTGEVSPRRRSSSRGSWRRGIAWLWFDANWLAAGLGSARSCSTCHLHDGPQAPHPAEHRLGRCRRLHARADRLGRRHRAVAWTAVILFLVVFLWTPPHYWPLSMRYREDTQRQRADARRHRRRQVGLVQVVLYAWATVACSLLLIPAAARAGLRGRGRARGAWFLYEAHRLYDRAQARRRRTRAHARVPRIHHVPDPAVHRPRCPTVRRLRHHGRLTQPATRRPRRRGKKTEEPRSRRIYGGLGATKRIYILTGLLAGEVGGVRGCAHRQGSLEHVGPDQDAGMPL